MLDSETKNKRKGKRLSNLFVLHDGKKIELLTSPYYLERICNKQVSKSKDSMGELIQLQQKIDSWKLALERKLQDVDTLLYEEISNMPGANAKDAIKLKRSVANKKFAKITEKQQETLSKEVRASISECEKLYHEINKMEIEKQELFECNEKEAAHFLRKELKNNISYSNALAMSVYNDELYKNILELKTEHEVVLNKKMRNTIVSLRNYHNRMVKKPSPFSTFVCTKISLVAQDCNAEGEVETSYTPKVYINELIPKTLENLFLEDHRFLEQFFVKLNPTLQIQDDFYEYLNVDVSNSKMYYSENVLKIKRTPKVDFIVEGLKKKGNQHLLSFAEQLYRSHNSEFNSLDEIIVFILKLDVMGVVYKNFNVDHLDYSIMGKLCELCKVIDDEKYRKIQNSIETINKMIEVINRDFSLDVECKRKLQENIFSEVEDIFSHYPNNVCDLHFIKKNILYENNTYPHLTNKSVLPDEITREFYYAEKLYRLFDNNYMQRIMFRNIFLENYDINAEVPILDFYKQVTVSYKESTVRLLENDEDINIISNLRKELLDYINVCLQSSKKDVELSLEQIESLYQRFPKIMRDKTSYGIYYQADAETYVINNISPGMGRHFIRYISDLEEADQKRFMKEYKKHIKGFERDNFKFTDIGTSLGLSINKHLEALNAAFAYPKSVYKNEVELHDLRIVFDKATESVKVVDENHVVYDSTPIGFLFPRISPSFYSFLSTFSNSRGASMSFWDRYYSQYENKELAVEHYPRLTVGRNIIIERETWKIKEDYFTDEGTGVDSYIDFYHSLCRGHGIPPRFFAKKSSDIDAIQELGKSTEEWEEIITNNKLRKPQYYDLNNYLDYIILQSLMKNYCKLPLTIQENLPDTNNPVECLVELNEIKMEG